LGKSKSAKKKALPQGKDFYRGKLEELLNKKVTRRQAIATGGKVAIGVGAVVVVGAAGYAIYSLNNNNASSNTSSSSSSSTSAGAPIIIGVAEDIHGANGPGIIKAVELAVNEVNSKGESWYNGPAGAGITLNGQVRPLKVVVEDTQEEQSTFVSSNVITAVTKLITDDHANVIFGGFGGSGYIPDLSAQYKIIYISGSGGSIDQSRITPTNQYHYEFQDQIDVLGYGNEATLCTLYYAQKYNAKSVAYVTEDQAFFHVYPPQMKPVLAQAGIELLDPVFFPPTQTDFTSIIDNIRSSGAAVTFEGFLAANSVPFMQQWKNTQLKTFLVSFDIPAGVAGADAKANGAYDYLVVLEGPGRVSITPMSIPFWDNFTQFMGRTPDVYDANYYAATHMYAGAVQQAQTLDADTIATTIHNGEWLSPMGKVTFNDHNFVSPANPVENGFVSLMDQWQNGQLKVVWPAKFAEGPTLYPPWHQPPS